MLADHHGHLGVRVAHGHRRRAARLDRRGRRRERKIRAHHGKLPDDACDHGAGADGAVRVLCRAAFTDVRREREHRRLRARLYANLCPRHDLRAADTWHERLHHGTGLRHREHEDGAHRRALKYGSRPAVHLRARSWRARRGAGDGDLAGSVGRVGDDVPHGKEDALAFKAREPARGREDRVAVYRAGTFPVCDAVDGEPHRHLLQLIAPALRRRHGRRHDDSADEHHAVFEHAASGLDAGRTAHRELQFRRKERPARARCLLLPAARVLYLFNGHLASGRALPARVHPDFQ